MIFCLNASIITINTGDGKVQDNTSASCRESALKINYLLVTSVGHVNSSRVCM